MGRFDDEMARLAREGLPPEPGRRAEETDDFSWVDWRPIDTYREDGELVLTRATATSQLFGRRRDGIWHEMVDGVENAKRDYQPVEWTPVPGDRWAYWAM